MYNKKMFWSGALREWEEWFVKPYTVFVHFVIKGHCVYLSLAQWGVYPLS